jgi:hypothetical protein
MSGEFVPFLPSIKAQVVTSPVSTEGNFSPIQSPTRTPEVCHPEAELKVELKREGDRITQIKIQCRCGETIELDCEY